MKLTLERDLFAKKLQAAMSALGNSHIPILNESLLQVKNDRLFITCSNGEVQLTVSLPCVIEGEAKDLVFDLKLFQAPVINLKTKEVFLELKDDLIVLSAEKRKNSYEAPIVYSAVDYPLLKAEEWSPALDLSGSVFSKMVKKASIFVDNKNIREGMRGISLQSIENTITVQSVADGGQVICHLECLPTPDSLGFSTMERILMPKAIMNVAAEFEKSASVKVSTDDKRKSVRVHDGNSIVVVRLLDGVFPDCSPFVTSFQPSINAKILNEEITLALKRAANFSSESNQVVIDMTNGSEITLEFNNQSFKKKAFEVVPVPYKSEEMNFVSKANYKYLGKCLAEMSGESIFMSQLKAKDIIYITDDSSEGFSTLWLVAPMV